MPLIQPNNPNKAPDLPNPDRGPPHLGTHAPPTPRGPRDVGIRFQSDPNVRDWDLCPLDETPIRNPQIRLSPRIIHMLHHPLLSVSQSGQSSERGFTDLHNDFHLSWDFD